MDIKYLINICLILLILHIILINLNFNIKIGKNTDFEKFTNNDDKSNVDFLTSDKDSNEEFKKKLLKYKGIPGISYNLKKHHIDFLSKTKTILTFTVAVLANSLSCTSNNLQVPRFKYWSCKQQFRNVNVENNISLVQLKSAAGAKCPLSYMLFS